MDLQPIVIAAFALGVIALIVQRQLRWTRFDATRALRTPLVLAVIAAAEVALTWSTVRITATDVALVAAEVAVAAGVGAAMGAMTVFRPAQGAIDGWETRTGALGAALWLVLIGLRVGVGYLGPQIGASAAASTGVLLLVLAAARGATALVVRSRAPQGALVSA